jgi:hypothetical protein
MALVLSPSFDPVEIPVVGLVAEDVPVAHKLRVGNAIAAVVCLIDHGMTWSRNVFDS